MIRPRASTTSGCACCAGRSSQPRAGRTTTGTPTTERWPSSAGPPYWSRRRGSTATAEPTAEGSDGDGDGEEMHMSGWPRDVPEVGARASMTRTVEPADIVRFTELSGDRNPLHYDAEAAARTRFGEIVVQGGVTSAILNAVVAAKLPG